MNSNTNPKSLNSDAKASSWVQYKNIALHVSAASEGLFVAKKSISVKTPKITKNNFIFDNKTLSIEKDEKKIANVESIQGLIDLLNQLYAYAIKEPILTFCHGVVYNLLQCYLQYTADVVIMNLSEKTNIFLPYPSNAWFIFPRLSNRQNKMKKFEGFEQFSSHINMFGSSLLAFDDYEQPITIARNELMLYSKQKFLNVHYFWDGKNPFLEQTKQEIVQQLNFVAQHSASRCKNIIFHLPLYDYILFYVFLYLGNHFTTEALESVIDSFFKMSELLINFINTEAIKRNVTVTFQSPFENLFNPIKSLLEKTYRYKKEHIENQTLSFTKAIFNLFDIPSEENLSTVNAKDHLLSWLKKLLKDPQFVWDDFIKINEEGYTIHSSQKNSIFFDEKSLNVSYPLSMYPKIFNPILTAAKVVMLATAAKGKSDHSVCSMCTVSDEYIQKQYAQYVEKKSGEYPAMFFITSVEKICYTFSQGNGSLQHCVDDSFTINLASIIEKWPSVIKKRIHSNHPLIIEDIISSLDASTERTKIHI